MTEERLMDLMQLAEKMYEATNKNLDAMHDMAAENRARLAGLGEEINGWKQTIKTASEEAKAKLNQEVLAIFNTRVVRLFIKTLLGILGAFTLLAIVQFLMIMFLSATLSGQQEEKASLQEEIKQNQLTLEALKAKTWGIRLQEYPDGKYIVLPKGCSGSSYGKLDGCNAVKLSK